MKPSFEFEAPDHFTAGAIGEPGKRVFYLQSREAGTLVTLKAEKGQVGALAEYLAALLTKLPTADEPPADRALLEPIEALWAVGVIAVGYHDARRRIVIVAKELVEEDSTDQPAAASFHVTHAQAAAFVERARELMRAGRPICPMCSQSKDPDGHVCPRSNGHVVH